MIWRFAWFVFVAVVAASASPAAQSSPALELLLDRMGAYLEDYETHLSSVVADERLRQTVYSGGSLRNYSRTLESEVAFIRLPGGAEWLGFRDVRKVDSKAVGDSGPSISAVLTASGSDLTRARAIAQTSAKHNLGLPRTVNVPTAPLDIVHPMHRGAHEYRLVGHETVRGARTAVISFLESTRPTLLREPGGRDLVSSGRVWIEPETGRLWRVEWIYQGAGSRPPPPRLRVDFAPHAELGFMVPMSMTEVFSVSYGSGNGRATYTNFRRFGTSARIVPEEPR